MISMAPSAAFAKIMASAFSIGASKRASGRPVGSARHPPPDEVTTPVEPVGPPVAQMPDDEMQMLDTDDMADIMKDPDSAIFSAAEAVEAADYMILE